MFKEYDSSKNLPQLEHEILKFWDKNKIYEKSIENRKDFPAYIFFEGPPTANGKPGIHHVVGRTLKDIICRYKSMDGFKVERKAGWDTHGLPVEIEVEKFLGLDGKEQIEDYGIEKFNAKCKESVFSYKNEWDELTKRIGYWINLDDPYITFKDDYIETVWYLLKQLHDKKLIYKGFKILPYCPRCQTPLSSHEVSQGYKEVKDPSVYVKVAIKDEPDTKFLVWTTTPWTLISNVALAIHPEVDYVKIELGDEKLILAKARLSALFKDDEYNIINTFKGRELEKIEYIRMFDFVPADKPAFYVVTADFVTTEDGSGIVHIAPAFGDDDYQIGKKYDLPVLRPVNASGAFDEVVTDYKGKFVKDADPDIIQNLKERNILFKKEKFLHSYPHCWRCQTPLIYYARESWYIETSKYKDRMMEVNDSIEWYPPEVGKGRFGEWLKNNVDWAISRDRYWGTPLNIWMCEKCEHQTSIGSKAELKEKGKNVPDNIELHKPYVDNISLSCEKCNGEMKRVPEVIDCWFDSGAMPYAQWHYPFENMEEFDNKFPADFISEGIDQTRGWFYSLLAISTMISDKSAYKRVIVNELILDKNGQKMSKSRGNSVVPSEVIEKYGADAIRWYFATISFPWVPKRYDNAGVEEVVRKFFNTLLNTYSFFVMYANIDNFNPENKQVDFSKRSEMDRWILSALYKLVEEAGDYLKNYDLTRSARAISTFVLDDLSNWYVRRNRRRFWKSGDSTDKLAAYQTLYEVLLTISRLTAPFIPFLSEWLYDNLHTSAMPESVHLCNYPEVSEEMKTRRNAELEMRMSVTENIVSLIRALRNKTQLKVRQPLIKAIVATTDSEVANVIKQMEDIIKEEVNIKEVEIVEDSASFVVKNVKPNFKTLGPRYGKIMGEIAGIIKGYSAKEIKHLEDNKEAWLAIKGHDVHITLDDVEIMIKPATHFEVVYENNMIIGLDTEITEALKEEGLAREFVNRIQNLRKDADFEIIDKIKIGFIGSDEIQKAISSQMNYIKNETLAAEVSFHTIEEANITKDVEIEGDKITLSIQKIS